MEGIWSEIKRQILQAFVVIKTLLECFDEGVLRDATTLNDRGLFKREVAPSC